MSARPVVDLQLPVCDDAFSALRAGDSVLLSGRVYVARDAAHKRLAQALAAGQELPFAPYGEAIYYAGPSPARPGRPTGSIGPTTSGRMDPYTVPLLEAGVKVLIGKGARSAVVRQALQAHGAVYLAVTGGVAALIARSVVSSEVVAYEDLGPEALRRLEVVRMPAVVVNDIHGGDAYERGRVAFRRVV